MQDVNLLGTLLLLAAAAFWLAVARFAGRAAGASFRDTLPAFGAGMLAFPMALLVQKAALMGGEPVRLGALAGTLCVLLLVGPSEELCKAMMMRLACRRVCPLEAPGCCMAGIAAAAGYAFLEHLGRFLDPATALLVLGSKAIVGTALHATLSVFWSLPMAAAAGGWPPTAPVARGVLLAGVIHGSYNAGSFLPAWTAAPIWVALLWQVAIVAMLLAAFVARLSALAPSRSLPVPPPPG